MKLFPNKTEKNLSAVALVVIGVLIGSLLGIGLDRLWHSPVSASRSPVGTGQVVGQGQMAPADLALQDVQFKQFWDLWQLLKTKYYQQPVKDKDLFYGAMAGLASSLGDPYTEYFEPVSAADFEQALSGKFEGIGAEIGMKDQALTVIAPLPDTPAERAGVQAGDIILKIDSQDTTGMTVDKAVGMIRGAKGTKVVLNLFRPAASKKPPFDVTIVRDVIQVKSVNAKMLPGNIADIEVTHFNEDTKSGFDAAVADILKKDPKGIVLDLRNDPGGFLDEAIDMAGNWVGDGVVVQERRQGKITQVYKGTSPKRLAGIPTVVLVNQGSASAAEIVAGALQDYGAATLVGTKTFGKGSVQDYSTFEDGSGIKVTIAEWLTPKERTINKTGLDPDVFVDLTPEDYDAKRDPQLDRAVGILNGTATSTASAAPATARQ